MIRDLLQALVKDIESHTNLVLQWSTVREPGWAQNYSHYMSRLEALVNLLEAYDCGSHGGFGKGQGFKRGEIQCNDNHNPGDLFDRARWLIRKYKVKAKRS